MHTLALRPSGRKFASVVSEACSRRAQQPFSSTSTARSFLGVDRTDRRTAEQISPRQRRPPRWQMLGEPERPRIKVYPPIQSTRTHCKDPVATVSANQYKILDPTGARAKLFDKLNPEGVKVGDILLVRQRNGDPFAGVCLNIRQRGVDTAILLRNQLTRVGVEMWYKVFSPNVEGIEVVQRRAKRARRARLYYMRKPKHDLGSVENIVTQYQRRKQALRSGAEAKGRDANSGRRKHAKSK